MSQEEYERRGGNVGSGRVHLTACQRTGEVFVRPLDGRFRGLPRGELRDRLADLQRTLVAMGGMPLLEPAMPMHQQLEYLENILEFEVTLPCGCGSGGVPMAEA